MKICTRCGERKPLPEFAKDKRRKDGRGSWCKPCQAASQKRYVEANPETTADYARKYRRAHRQRHAEYCREYRRANPEKTLRGNAGVRAYNASRRRFLQSVKLTVGCIDCGYAEDPGRLHFDHRPGAVKDFDPAHGKGYSWLRLVAEIEKCDVRCIRCHPRRHARLRAGAQA